MLKLLTTYATVCNAILGVCCAALTMLGLALDGMQNPWVRWGAWLLAAIFFVVAAISAKAEKSQTILPNGDHTLLPNRTRAWLVGLSVVALAVLAGDVLFISLRSPIKWTPMTVSHSIDPESQSEDQIPVEAMESAITTESQTDIYGISATSIIAMLSGIDQLLIRDLTVEVVDFKLSPIDRSLWAGLAEMDSLDAWFVLEQKKSALPWEFKPTDVRLNEKPCKLPLQVTDTAPFTLNYWINARDPGIYWVKFVVWVSNGVSPAKRVELTPVPIVLAYYPADTEPRTRPIDEFAPKFERLPAEPIAD